MHFTRQADYGLRTVLYLAGLEAGESVATSKIARDQHIPTSFLAKIVSQLAIAGVLRTARGARGGVSLARPAARISVLDVVQAIDGPIELVHCLDDPEDCIFSQACSIQQTLQEAQQALRGSLASTDFASLASKQAVMLS
jgi:Rrf2 family protein